MTHPLVHHDLFGGRGKVTVELERQGEPRGFACVLRCALAPRGRVGLHEQEACDELVIVLSGRGRALTDGARTALKPGVVVPVPLGTQLSLENTSPSAPLRYLIVKARP